MAENPGIVWGLAANSTVFVLGIKVLLSGLTWAGVLHSWFLGSTVYSAFGLGGYILVCLYFLLGSLVCEEESKHVVCQPRFKRLWLSQLLAVLLYYTELTCCEGVPATVGELLSSIWPLIISRNDCA